MNWKWPLKSRYVALLEEERERLLAENSNLQMKLEQARRALLISSNSPAAQTYIRREEPPLRPEPIRMRESLGTSWDEYESQWAVHLEHNQYVSGCQFCREQAAAAEDKKEREKEMARGIEIVNVKT